MNMMKYLYIGDKLLQKSQDKKIILEPFCCLTRLALLTYKQEHTKLCIHENGIYYVEQHAFQGLIRSYYGDKREDLHNLYAPIMKSFEWFPKSNPNYKYIYEIAVKGLDKFTNTYDKNSIIYHTLLHYKTIIEEYLQDNNHIQQEVGESPLIDNLQTIWTDDEKNIVHDILKLIERNKQSTIYIQLLETLLCDKESNVNTIIKKQSTSYDS
jgi:hypothetical protein